MQLIRCVVGSDYVPALMSLAPQASFSGATFSQFIRSARASKGEALADNSGGGKGREERGISWNTQHFVESVSCICSRRINILNTTVGLLEQR